MFYSTNQSRKVLGTHGTCHDTYIQNACMCAIERVKPKPTSPLFCVPRLSKPEVYRCDHHAWYMYGVVMVYSCTVRFATVAAKNVCSCPAHPFHRARPRRVTAPKTTKPKPPSTAKGCTEEGCDRRPIYAYKGKKKPAYCARHR